MKQSDKKQSQDLGMALRKQLHEWRKWRQTRFKDRDLIKGWK